MSLFDNKSDVSDAGEDKSQKHINFALVEDTRPPMYTAMKYWGKKPHNIWNEFIQTYCPANGIMLDPFAGSAISAFEAVKAGRKIIATDINPLTSFIIEVLAVPFDEAKFQTAFSQIVSGIESDSIYKEHFIRKQDGKTSTVLNYRWFQNEVVKVGVENADGTRHLIAADAGDAARAQAMKTIVIPFWHPTAPFPASDTFKHKFITDLGGNGFQYLWTNRNLYVLARIFDEISRQQDAAVRMQLYFGFLQSLHLTSRMVVPRSQASKRDFSGSWGRADYMIRSKSMEQNALDVFKRSCGDKQGVLSALRDAKQSLPSTLKIADIAKNRAIRQTADINYGVVDVADISQYIKPKSVDFILTDPPYGGLVQYLDLSLVWLSWLQHLDKKYSPDLAAEITVKNKKKPSEREQYRLRLRDAFKQLHTVLKDDGYLVVTFHNAETQEWNDFVQAIKLAGFRFDKVTHQYNRRSGEANVANPYGTSGADFYIRCVKQRNVDFTNDASGLEHFVVQKAIEIIALRNEETPYEFIMNGLIPEMLQVGYFQPSQYQQEITKILLAQVGPDKVFVTRHNSSNKAGDYWWFAKPSEYINYPDLPLQDRVEETVLSILRRQVSVKFDDVLGQLFRAFPNGLTPDPRGIVSVLEEYAVKSSGKWKIKPVAQTASTKHTNVIQQLALIGKKSGALTYIGKREQSELCSNGALLRDTADLTSLSQLAAYNDKQLLRIEMIDLIWLSQDGQEIQCVFEVENSTKFMAAIQRASNLPHQIPKFMVIPDSRKTELLNTRDPLFVSSFHDNNWRFLTYVDAERLVSYSKPSVSELLKTAQTIAP